MQTRALRTLTRIARHASFGAAADELHMTLSAVSMQMKALEAELGVALFDRTHRPPRLTPLGRAAVLRAEALLVQEDALLAACRAEGPLSGRFRIGFVATASIRLLPGFLARARKAAPEARFDIETGTSEALEGRVLAGQLDAAVVTASPVAPAGLSYMALRRERLVPAIPASAGAVPLAALFGRLPFFHFQPGSGIGKLIAAHVAPHMPAGAQVIYLDSVEAIMECVNGGIGFTLLPEPDVRRTIRSDALIGPDTGPPLFRTLALANASSAPAERSAGLAGLLSEPPS